MSKRITLPFPFDNAQVVLWDLLSLLILAPTSSLYAQDQDDVDEVVIKRTIPGKKIRSVEVIAKIVSDNQSQK